MAVEFNSVFKGLNSGISGRQNWYGRFRKREKSIPAAGI